MHVHVVGQLQEGGGALQDRWGLLEVSRWVRMCSAKQTCISNMFGIPGGLALALTGEAQETQHPACVRPEQERPPVRFSLLHHAKAEPRC